MVTYIIVITVVFVIIQIIAMRNAPDFTEATGYDPRCFDCHETNCKGCVVTGPCYGCDKECDGNCPFDPILGQFKAEGGYYFDNNCEIIGTYTKGE